MTIYTFKPTCLYIKQHSITGKKYFGKTTKDDPEKYLGSGKYWRNHITKYGKQYVVTTWMQWFTNEQECREYALKFSVEHDIVNSDDWANLMLEDGLTGSGSPGRKVSNLTRQKHSDNANKRLLSGTHHFKNKEFKESEKERKKKAVSDGSHPIYQHHREWSCVHCRKHGKGNTQFYQHINGKGCSDFFKPKKTTGDRVIAGTHNFLGSELQRKRVLNGTHPSQIPWTCDHCGKSGKGKGMFTRYHGTSCKLFVEE